MQKTNLKARPFFLVSPIALSNITELSSSAYDRTPRVDLVVTSLLYDTFIFLANLLVVFQDRAVEQMVVDVLALEFFTLIDDEFKAAVIEYDSTFLYEMLRPPPGPSELPGPRRHADDYTVRSASYMDPPVRRAPLTEALFDPTEDGGESGPSSTSRGTAPRHDPEAYGDLACAVVVAPLKLALLIVRAVCRICGPLIAFIAIFYGPYCLGPP